MSGSAIRLASLQSTAGLSNLPKSCLVEEEAGTVVVAAVAAAAAAVAAEVVAEAMEGSGPHIAVMVAAWM